MFPGRKKEQKYFNDRKSIRNYKKNNGNIETGGGDKGLKAPVLRTC